VDRRWQRLQTEHQSKADQRHTYCHPRIHAHRPDLLLHGFGLKLAALQSQSPTVRALLYSLDSMAWSFGGRKWGRKNDSSEHDPIKALVYAAQIEALIGQPSFVQSCSHGRFGSSCCFHCAQIKSLLLFSCDHISAAGDRAFRINAFQTHNPIFNRPVEPLRNWFFWQFRLLIGSQGCRVRERSFNCTGRLGRWCSSLYQPTHPLLVSSPYLGPARIHFSMFHFS
jgi:hypothetical protein